MDTIFYTFLTIAPVLFGAILDKIADNRKNRK